MKLCYHAAFYAYTFSTSQIIPEESFGKCCNVIERSLSNKASRGFSESFVNDQYIVRSKKLACQPLERAIKLYHQFLELLLLYPNQPLVPNHTIDTIFHLQFELMPSLQECLPFSTGLIRHRPFENSQRVQKGFWETATKFKQFGVTAVEEFLLDGPGACDILYYPNVDHQNEKKMLALI